MWCNAEKRFVRLVCSRNPFLPFFLWIPSLHSLPEAWGSWERQNAGSVLHYGCKRSHPFVAAAGKTCLMQRSIGFGHEVVVSKICFNAVIVLLVVLCDCCKPMNNCRNWAFRNSGLEVGLPTFQLPMFAKCDALDAESRFVGHELPSKRAMKKHFCGRELSYPKLDSAKNCV